jgi:hypothetical protein
MEIITCLNHEQTYKIYKNVIQKIMGLAMDVKLKMPQSKFAYQQI